MIFPKNNFIQQAWGMNYFYYKIGKHDKFFEVDSTFLKRVSETFIITSVHYPYYIDDSESSKSTKIKCQDFAHKYEIIIKNKDGQIHPRTVMVNMV
jgi:hypothetical protein